MPSINMDVVMIICGKYHAIISENGMNQSLMPTQSKFISGKLFSYCTEQGYLTDYLVIMDYPFHHIAHNWIMASGCFQSLYKII